MRKLCKRGGCGVVVVVVAVAVVEGGGGEGAACSLLFGLSALAEVVGEREGRGKRGKPPSHASFSAAFSLCLGAFRSEFKSPSVVEERLRENPPSAVFLRIVEEVDGFEEEKEKEEEVEVEEEGLLPRSCSLLALARSKTARFVGDSGEELHPRMWACCTQLEANGELTLRLATGTRPSIEEGREGEEE